MPRSSLHEAQRKAFELQTRLVFGPLPPPPLSTSTRQLTQAQLDDVAEERDLVHKCGLPTCDRPSRVCPSQDPEVKTYVRGYFVQRIVFYRFCSEQCFEDFNALPTLNTRAVRWVDADADADADDASSVASEDEKATPSSPPKPVATAAAAVAASRDVLPMKRVQERSRKDDAKHQLLPWNELDADGLRPDEDPQLPAFALVFSLFAEWTALAYGSQEPWYLERKAQAVMQLEQHAVVAGAEAGVALRRELGAFVDSINLSGASFARLRDAHWDLAAQAIVLYLLEQGRIPSDSLRGADTSRWDAGELASLVRALSSLDDDEDDAGGEIDFARVADVVDVQVSRVAGRGRERQTEFRLLCAWPNAQPAASWHPARAVYERAPDKVRRFVERADLPPAAVAAVPFLRLALNLPVTLSHN